MNILVVSSHPDDETLGAGGTLLRSRVEGAKIYWLNFTDRNIEYDYPVESVRKREEEINIVKKMYKFNGFVNLGLNPASLDLYSRKDLINKVVGIMQEIKPHTVIVPFYNDIHSDHKIVFDVVYSCTKTFRFPFIKKILMMEILSETEFASSSRGFVPNYFVDITKYLKDKLKIVSNYSDELQPSPFPRSLNNIKALAAFRGATAGCHYAEAFILLKEIR